MISYHWTDVQEIAEKLVELYPDEDPQFIRFTDLHHRICEIPEFKDDPKRSNEKILEAIQSAWIEIVAE